MVIYLADAFIESDSQLIRLSRGKLPTWSNAELRVLLKGPTAVWILSWLEPPKFWGPAQS